MLRKDFIKMGSIIAATLPQFNVYAADNSKKKDENSNEEIDFIYDGLLFSPKDYSSLLMKLADEGKIKPDYYSNGGTVEELESKFSKLLGKESAIFMPTGTLANHIAVRHLSNNNRRIIVQEQSHLYNDSGDCAQNLSALNLIPVGENSVEFSLSEVEKIVEKTKKGRVETRLGVISIESPVRRQNDRMFLYDKLKVISNYAKNNEIKMHMDGARLFVQSVHTNIVPAKYGELFDTVYTSLWKCFNAGSGAVLAGSKAFTEKLFHERRMFGGSLPTAWAFAAVALHFSDSFTDDYKNAWLNAEIFFSGIQKNERFKIIKFENGSHIIKLNINKTNVIRFKDALSKKNIQLPDPNDENGFLLKINPSINRGKPEDLIKYFIEALKTSD
jgi:threonine aldolase